MFPLDCSWYLHATLRPPLFFGADPQNGSSSLNGIRRRMQAHGEDEPIFSQRLERDGWELKLPWQIENHGYPKLFHTIQPEIREKFNVGCTHVIRLTRSIEYLDYSPCSSCRAETNL